jgi:Sulfotransferase family
MAAALTESNRSPAPESSNNRPAGPILILGAPRSGTSWLGKIFDSHPAVIYRHEPDSVLRPTDFPLMCPIEDIPRHSDAARRYILRLAAVRQVKSSGTRPIFSKPFQPFPAPFIRRALAFGLRAAESAIPRAAWPKRMAIPDFIRGDLADITYVIKSVTLLDAGALLARALPESRIVAVFRHPCGQLASTRRGVSAGRVPGAYFGPRCLATARARELGLTRERYEEKLTPLERSVWAWACLHARLFDETGNLPNVFLLRYEDLCRNPLEKTRAVLAFAGLPWARETAGFIERSTRGSGREGYFSVFRDPMEAATGWKRELPPGEIAICTAILEEVLPGLFPSD